MTLTLVLIALLVACALNAIGDVILLWGVRETNWQPGIEALAKTPEPYVVFGSMLGLATIPVWFLIAPYLAQVPGLAGRVAFFSYLTYVAGVFAFHLCYAFVGVGVQASEALKAKFAPLVQAIAGYSFLAAVVFTVAMIVSGASKSVQAEWYHYATLPLFTIILFQMVLGQVLKGVPYYWAASGTVAMAAFFIGFIDLVRRNPDLGGG